VSASTFEIKTAVRERVPLLLGLVGPSGSGKSVSSLRLATGIQRVVGGDIGAADTESRRLLAYADRWKFKHVDFRPPYSPDRYLAVIRALYDAGCRTIIVDSTSHEWEGVGGVLEMATAEVERMAKGDPAKAERVKMASWIKPKAEHRKFIAGVLQMDCNFIFNFRAREKIKPVKGGNPIELGFQAIAPDDIVFEMTWCGLLLPGCDGVPARSSDFVGERALIKTPDFFKPMLASGVQLNEDIGEQLARWAAGDSAGKAPSKPASQPVNQAIVDLLDGYAECVTEAQFNDLETKRKALWATALPGQKEQLKAASAACKSKLTEGANA
jgi:ABC-type oligopeptide transport system ATPase subunit